MTREERLRIVRGAHEIVLQRIDGTQDFYPYRDACMKAVSGAARLLGRNPLDLAELLADGRLALYIRAGEETIPLPLDDPAPAAAPIEEFCLAAAEWADQERARLESRFQRLASELEELAAEFRNRELWIGVWQRAWENADRKDAEYFAWVREREAEGWTWPQRAGPAAAS